jgi:predicted dehydrogenase
MSQELTVGIFGLGKMGRIRKRELEASASTRVIGVCDPNIEAVDAASEGGLRTTDVEHLLDARPDVVFVCTPNNVTAQIAVAALERGMHVFCEKPPGRDLSDTKAILEAWRASTGKKLKFGFNHRYHDSVIQAFSLVNSGRMGDLLWMRGVYGKSGGVEFEKGWRSDREVAGGGILLDQGIHMLDLFRLFAGEFNDVLSMVSQRFWSTDVEDNAFALLRGESGVVASLHSSSTHWKHTFLLDICLSEGHLTLDGILSGTGSYGPETLRISRRQFEDESYALGKPRQEVIYFDTDPSWKREVEEFIDCILNDKPVQVGTARDAWKTMELVTRIYAADESWRHAGYAAEDLTRSQSSSPELKEAL